MRRITFLYDSVYVYSIFRVAIALQMGILFGPKTSRGSRTIEAIDRNLRESREEKLTETFPSDDTYTFTLSLLLEKI